MNMHKPFLLIIAFILMVMAVFASVGGKPLTAFGEGILTAITVFIYEIDDKGDDDEDSR